MVSSYPVPTFQQSPLGFGQHVSLPELGRSCRSVWYQQLHELTYGVPVLNGRRLFGIHFSPQVQGIEKRLEHRGRSMLYRNEYTRVLALTQRQFLQAL